MNDFFHFLAIFTASAWKFPKSSTETKDHLLFGKNSLGRLKVLRTNPGKCDERT
jgi:hypothetical protein